MTALSFLPLLSRVANKFYLTAGRVVTQEPGVVFSQTEAHPSWQ